MKNPFGFGKVRRIKLGGKWTYVIAPEKLLSKEESLEQLRELQKKIHGKNGNGH